MEGRLVGDKNESAAADVVGEQRSFGMKAETQLPFAAASAELHARPLWDTSFFLFLFLD